MEIFQVSPQITALVTPVPVPGLGFLPVNAFVITGSGSPLLVDTCVTQPSGEFAAGLSKVVDPADIESIWLTHPDRDHTGALLEMLAAAPRARVLTHFTSVGHLLVGPEPIPLDRVRIVNPGDVVEAAGRKLVAFRPPLYDNPGTVGFFDATNGILVSSDCFGGPMASAEEAAIPDVAAIPADQLRQAQLIWGSADSPWVHSIDESKFAESLDGVRKFDPAFVLSTHLPPIHGDIETHLATLTALPGSPPVPGPDQAALEALLAEMEPPQP